MFAIIAALWSVFVLWLSISQWGWIENRVLYYSSSWGSAFTVWLVGNLIIWLVPIYTLKFFIYLFS